MKCPKCGNQLSEGKLLCEKCGEEVKYVPDFDIELEHELRKSISSIMEELSDKEPEKREDERFETEDIKDKLSDYFPKKQNVFLNFFKKKKIMTVAIIMVVIILAAGAVGVTGYAKYSRQRENSYDYQYQKALECANMSQYDEAISYLERALAIDDSQTDARFLLAQYYDENGMRTSAVSVLHEILAQRTDYLRRDEVYDALLTICEEEKDYEQMGAVLAACDVARIVSKYNKYAALPPEFNKQGGTYDEIISITLDGNTEGKVYYTMDGTEPVSDSSVYETPILLESGDYVIRAMFVNAYGIMSDIVSQSYYINLSVPESPVVNLDSGTYKAPSLIEVYHNDDTKIYYTTDGSEPDKDSSRYNNPIEMPYGMSSFSFIAINSSGVRSEVVSRNYDLKVEANFDTELALEVLKNNLVASGKLLDTAGNVGDRLGHNQYRVQTVVSVEDKLYYIVYEEYMDTTGSVHDTNNIYAIDADSADLYKAYKIDEGTYHFSPFVE